MAVLVAQKGLPGSPVRRYSMRLGRLGPIIYAFAAPDRFFLAVSGDLEFLERHRFMPTVRVKENEPFEVAMRRFKRTVEKTGLLTELRAREFYEKPTAERKRKRAAAVKRHFKRIRSQQLPPRMY